MGWVSCFLTILFLFSLFSPATAERFEEPIPNVKRDSRIHANEPVRFINVSEEVGLAGVRGSRFSWADYDNDGDVDLLINGKRLFRNNGPPAWDFTEVTDEAGLYGSVNSGAWADYDNDGWLDFYATAGVGRQDILWRNKGDGTFENVTVQAGNVYDNLNSQASGWGDYDGDGFVDLYVANYEVELSQGHMDILWHNNGDGTFTNVTASAGIDDYARFPFPYPGRGVAWGDYDNDGDADIYVSNYRLEPNYLWENNGDGTFTERAFDRGVAGIERWYGGDGPYYGHTIGSAWGDIDNDGDLDLFVANLVHKDNIRWPWIRGLICDDSKLYQNNGSAENYSFWDIREAAGIPIIPPGETILDPASGDRYYRDELYSGPVFGDYDNDGDLDLFVTQVYFLGHADSHLFRNNGNLTFTNVTEEAGVKVWNSWGTAWADYDNDGDLDLIVEGSSYPNPFYEVRLYRNEGTPNSWLKVDLEGCWSNRAAIGARVTVSNGTTNQMREVEGGTGTGSSQNSLIVEFGFGNYTGPVDVRIRWPSGLIQYLNGTQLNQTLHITEISCLAAPTALSAELSGAMDRDVRITWTPSIDEGSTYFANYAVYRGMTYSRYGKGYSFVGSTLAGNTEFVDLGRGHGDPNSYFYYVQVNSTTGFAAKSTSQVAKFTKYLETGVNLLSVPILAINSSIESLLRTVSWDRAWTYYRWDTADPWKSHAVGKPFSDLTEIKPTAGIWVNILIPGYFTVAGAVPGDTQVPLKAGWNLVGFPSFKTDYYVSHARVATSCEKVEAFDGSRPPYWLRELLPNEVLMAGNAYWLKVPQDTTWTISN